MSFPTDQAALDAMRAWIEEVVVGQNFCPFAARPLRDNQVRMIVVRHGDPRRIRQALLDECAHLDRHAEVETTLLLLPEGFDDFDTFLELTALAEAALARQGYEGIYQVAHFHPHYRFADSLPDDPADYTNRAPVPALHLLRDASIERAVENHPDPEGIPARNVAHARAKGIDFMRALLERCRREK